jgi:hypothetical protein
MKIFLIIILTVLFSCNSKQGKEKVVKISKTSEATKNKFSSVDSQYLDNSKTEILETFVDSINIGEKGKCKIELIKHRVYADNFVIIRFYIKGRYTTKDPETWMNTNTYCYETNTMLGFEPNISDFNNDNLNDITFISGSAARGANEIRRLLVYDNKNEELISIVNSQSFPNMQYNKELNCIDAFIITGGTSTHFVRIKNDSLIEFASVHNDNNRTVYEIDKFGKEKLLRKDTIIGNENINVRYRNYKPLKEYKE